jgi:cell wall-associated NlpC family hydrolase
MASMRTAAALRFFVPALIAFACLSPPAFSSPFLPPERAVLDSPDLAPPALDASARLDVARDASMADAVDASIGTHLSPRRVLADFAMKLRNIAYVHGGRELKTGFDCSGFVRYVFEHSLGLELPSSSTRQFETGRRIDRDELRMGDLVFFRTQGRRISHVGIYLDNGLFIHSPSRGKRVRIDHLDGSYWAKRFAGAKRPDALS